MKALLIIIFFAFFACSQADPTVHTNQADSILKIEMHLSAFGVESDDFPNIDLLLDFSADTSYCRMWYYEPKHYESVYRLTATEMRDVLALLNAAKLDTLKKEYTTDKSDQPTSTTIIYKSTGKIRIEDYGLEGDSPLPVLYEMVYKFR